MEETGAKPLCKCEIGERTLFNPEFWQTSNFGKAAVLQHAGTGLCREMAFSQRREFCCSWNNLPKFGQDIEAFGEISVCTSSGKSSLDLPQGQFAQRMFSSRTSERSLPKADAEHYQI